MDSLSRRYYEHQLGAGMGPEFSLEKLYGYTEPVRRLIQREESTPQANEIPNAMPSWLPGDDYLINFRKGDPFSKVDQGYARLPGAGYAGEQDQVSPSLATTRTSRARVGSRPAVDSRWLLPSSLAQLWAKSLWFASCWKALPVRLAHLSPIARRRILPGHCRMPSIPARQLAGHGLPAFSASGRPITTCQWLGSGRSMNSLLQSRLIIDPIDHSEADSVRLRFCRFRRPLEPSSKPASASHRSCIRDRRRRSPIVLRLFHGNTQGEHVSPTVS